MSYDAILDTMDLVGEGQSCKSVRESASGRQGPNFACKAFFWLIDIGVFR